SFGRLVKDKNFDLLIHAFAKISSKNPFWMLEIYGDGPERANLQKIIDAYDLKNRVKLLGSTALVFEKIYSSEFCVHPSKIESFGMVYIECFSLSKPVVSYDIGTGPKDFLIDNHNCLLAECYSI